MPFTYKPLWKLLIDRGMTKTELRLLAGLSTSTIAKMGKDEYVSMEVLDRLCACLNCQPGDLLSYIPDKEGRDGK